MSATRDLIGSTAQERAAQKTVSIARKIEQRVAGRLDELAQLRDDWDSYGGLAPTEPALAAGRALATEVGGRLGEVVGEKTGPYNIAPLADGGIQVEWRRGRDALEVWVWISPEGTLGYLLVEDHAGEARYSEADEVAWSSLLGLIDRTLLR